MLRFGEHPANAFCPSVGPIVNLTIFFYLLGYILILPMHFVFEKFAKRYGGRRTVIVKNLNVYKYEDSEEEDQNSIEITHL